MLKDVPKIYAFSVPFLSFDYSCIDSSNLFPASVSRYFCLLLRGLSGIVISMRPKLSIFSRLRLKFPVRVEYPDAARISWPVLGLSLHDPRMVFSTVVISTWASWASTCARTVGVTILSYPHILISYRY